MRIDDIAEKVTRAIGSGPSLVVHTIIFSVCIVLIAIGFHAQTIMLGLTTIVSLEAIYLSLLIQISVNKSNRTMMEISADVDEIQHDIDEIAEDVEGIGEDVDEIQKDIDEIQEDVEDISEEVEDIGEELDIEETAEGYYQTDEAKRLDRIETVLVELIKEIKSVKRGKGE